MKIIIIIVIVIAGGIALYKNLNTDCETKENHQLILDDNFGKDDIAKNPNISEDLYEYSFVKRTQPAAGDSRKRDGQLIDRDSDDDFDDEPDDDLDDEADGDVKKISDDEYLIMGMTGGLGIFDDE